MSDTMWERKTKQHMRLGRLYDMMSDRALKSGDIERGTDLGNRAMKEFTKAEEMMLEDMRR